MDKAQVVVIGAGIVGLSIAASISRYTEQVIVLEKNNKIGLESSTHNSGVIHSGIHYDKGTLKAILSMKGNEMIYDICEKYDIPFKKLGKLTVANGENEINELEKLWKKGEENGVPDMQLLEAQEIKKIEPRIKADLALLTPTTGIVEQNELLNYFYSKTLISGGYVAFNTEVVGLKKIKDYYEIECKSPTGKFSIFSDVVINSAGLYSDRIAEFLGLDVEKLGYRIQYVKGDYFRIKGSPPVKMLVYPIPEKNGLGIHLTPDIAGSVKIGPNAYFVDSIDYNVESSKNEFIGGVKNYFPSIVEYELMEDSSGIRPTLRNTNKNHKDFIISHESDKGYYGFINLIGIESPGLTAAPAIGEFVSNIYNDEIKK